MRKPGSILFVAALHGLLYVFAMLPWQHYDEPSHFEKVWLIAQTRRLPETEEAPIEFRRALVYSMIASDFYKGLELPDPERLQPGTRILGLQYSQIDEPPFYYILAAFPVAFLQTQSLHIQLYGARLVSLVLFIFTIFAIGGLTNELTKPTSPLRLLVPLSAALLPGFTELMTAVNNDVGAIAVFSWFLWGCVRILRQGLTMGRIIWMIGTAVLAVLTKSTVFLAFPLALFVFFLLLTKTRWGKWIWLCGLGLMAVVILLTMTWQDAANWHRATSQTIPTRTQFSPAPNGDYVLEIQTASPTTPNWLRPLYQPLPLLGAQPLTFGVWMWTNANTPLEIRTPTLSTVQVDHFLTVQVTSTPVFYAYTVTLPKDSQRVWLTVFPAIRDEAVSVYYDGFLLAEGQFSGTELPQFTNSTGTEGTWGGLPFKNLIRNPSIESAQPAFRPEVDNILARILPDNARPSMLLTSLFDFQVTSFYYQSTARNLLETFWGRFGWGHIPLAGPVYTVLGWLTLAGLVGGVGMMFVRRRPLPAAELFFLGIVVLLVLGSTFLRGAIFIFVQNLFVPGARYSYPAIAPLLFFLVAGWQTLLAFIFRPFRGVVHSEQIRKLVFVAIILFFLVLDGYSLITIFRFNG